MRQALATKAQGATRRQVSHVQSFPAPVGGWNARDALAAMKPVDAVRLKNIFPRTTDCIARGGYDDHADTMTGPIETLAIYNSLSGTSKMFAASNGGLWDVSSAGAGSAQVATLTNGRFQWLNMGNGTNNYLLMFNGVDDPLYYDGASWISVNAGSSPALTGVTSSTLIAGMVYQGRLFLIQKNTLSFWYLAAGAVGGALTEFDLSSIARLGGYLVAMATWSFDGGDGPDDYAVFVTSEGEIIVYRGTNPSSASDWVKVGTYFLGKPIGRRCFVNYGGDLVLITQNGAFPLSASLQSASIDRRLALTNKIENAFNDAARSYSAVFGWEAIVLPLQSAMIFNIPTSLNTAAKQYVMNTITKAWCEFEGWQATTFAVFNDELYFALGDDVFKAWTGTADGEDDIVLDGKQAFSYFGTNDLKRFNLFRPVLMVNGPLSLLTGIDVDFRDDGITGEATYSVTGGAQWDVSNWDEGYWAAGLDVVQQWTSPQQNVGKAAAGKIKINNNSLDIRWMASDMIYETGGPL